MTYSQWSSTRNVSENKEIFRNATPIRRAPERASETINEESHTKESGEFYYAEDPTESESREQEDQQGDYSMTGTDNCEDFVIVCEWMD